MKIGERSDLTPRPEQFGFDAVPNRVNTFRADDVYIRHTWLLLRTMMYIYGMR